MQLRLSSWSGLPIDRGLDSLNIRWFVLLFLLQFCSFWRNQHGHNDNATKPFESILFYPHPVLNIIISCLLDLWYSDKTSWHFDLTVLPQSQMGRLGALSIQMRKKVRFNMGKMSFCRCAEPSRLFWAKKAKTISCTHTLEAYLEGFVLSKFCFLSLGYCLLGLQYMAKLLLCRLRHWCPEAEYNAPCVDRIVPAAGSQVGIDKCAEFVL